MAFSFQVAVSGYEKRCPQKNQLKSKTQAISKLIIMCSISLCYKIHQKVPPEAMMR
jgi:hypothetical protein